MIGLDITKAKEELDKIFTVPYIVYPNGVFNALDINSAMLDTLLSKLKTSKSVKNFNSALYRNDNGESLYQVYGIVDVENINEKLEIHSELNPKLWGKDNKLLPEVEGKVREIVDYFIEQLAEDDVKLTPADIYIIGSNANFNYNESSDLDIHIIADESFDCSDKHLAIIYNAYKSLFNNKYDISVNGVNAEIYVDNKDALNHKSAGVYSLNDGWISDPAEYEIPDVDEAALDKSVSDWEKRYLTLVEQPSIDAVNAYIDEIYQLRKDGLGEAAEFSIGNLTFKEIRRLGYLDNLKELRDKLQGEALSL